MSLLTSRVAAHVARLPPELIVACLHTSAPCLGKRERDNTQGNAPSRTRLVKDLKPSRRADSGKLEVAPPPARDTAPHIGRPAHVERAKLRRPSTREQDHRRNNDFQPSSQFRGARKRDVPTTANVAESLKLQPPKTRGLTTDTKISNPLSEFDTSKRSFSPKELPKEFTSPPLMGGLLASVKDVLGPDACPSPIQALSLKHLVKAEPQMPADPSHYHQYLLASETGSGKSIAYLLPVLQDLKQSELNNTQRPGTDPTAPGAAITPRALVLAPTHELTRQLSGFAKELLHHIKLRVLCASRANVSSRRNVSASRLADALVEGGDGELEMPSKFVRSEQGHSVDVVVGTPSKVLELMRGRGWDHELREEEELHTRRKVNVGYPQMSVADIEWVVVDEADVLFDPDFQESTRAILADISAARGRPVEFDPTPDLAATEEPTPIDYPFNLILTSATIPASLAAYLDKFHPALTRLASPRLHRLPSTLKTEYFDWTGGNRDADIEHRLRRVWSDDMQTTGQKSKVLVFCNKSTRVELLGAHLAEKGIPNVALTRTSDTRKRGSNHHLDGFLRTRESPPAAPTAGGSPVAAAADANAKAQQEEEDRDAPHVLITTSLLSRGLDFAPDVRHVFIVDEPRNMVDFLHRAGRSGRAGEPGKVVVFGKARGRGSDKAREVRRKVVALKS